MTRDPRVVWNVEITPEAMAVVDGINEKYGTPKKLVVQRLMEFFADHPETIRQAMLDMLPADTAEHAAAVALRDYIDGAAKMKPRRAARAARHQPPEKPEK